MLGFFMKYEQKFYLSSTLTKVNKFMQFHIFYTLWVKYWFQLYDWNGKIFFFLNPPDSYKTSVVMDGSEALLDLFTVTQTILLNWATNTQPHFLFLGSHFVWASSEEPQEDFYWMEKSRFLPSQQRQKGGGERERARERGTIKGDRNGDPVAGGGLLLATWSEQRAEPGEIKGALSEPGYRKRTIIAKPGIRYAGQKAQPIMLRVH